IHLGGATFTVTQAGSGPPPPPPPPGPTCSPIVKPASEAFTSVGGSGTFLLSLNSGCPWQATPSASWVAITSASSGTGGAIVSYAVASNKTGSDRTATINIGGAIFTVQQQK